METIKSDFSFDEMRNQYNNGLLKDRLDCKNYISQYISPLMNGTHALIENEQVTIIQKDTMNEVYLARFPKDIKAWYKAETTPKRLICEVTKPTVGIDYVNISKTLKHKVEEYEKQKEECKKGVELMLSYIKEVWANNDDKVYIYILRWLANVTKGKKNKSCLYAKSLQGTGKSTLPEYLRDWVLGRDITCKGKADHLKGQHNLSLLGRVLVYFEELQIFSDKEWNAVDSELKDMITDDWGSYTDKYEKRFEAENINSYMVITNSQLKGINGRRYLVLDLSSKYMDDFEYYGKLRKMCFNDEVGKAFFCYLREIDTENFNSLDLPETKNKMEIIAELLPPIEKFLKFNFLLRKASIDMKAKDLHRLFKNNDSRNENVSIQRFCTLMRELGFEYKTLNGYSFYRISFDELETLGKRRKWLHVLDSEDENNMNAECMFINKAVCYRAEEYKEIQDLNENLKDSNECLKDDLLSALQYIKQLEECLNDREEKIEQTIKPKKRTKDINNIGDLLDKDKSKQKQQQKESICMFSKISDNDSDIELDM